MNIPDLINGAFEIGGGFLCWLNVAKLYKDKRIEGVYWPVQAFFSIWGIWNIFFYSHLAQWASFWGGIFLVLGNSTWTIMACYYTNKNKNHGESK